MLRSLPKSLQKSETDALRQTRSWIWFVYKLSECELQILQKEDSRFSRIHVGRCKQIKNNYHNFKIISHCYYCHIKTTLCFVNESMTLSLSDAESFWWPTWSFSPCGKGHEIAGWFLYGPIAWFAKLLSLRATASTGL